MNITIYNPLPKSKRIKLYIPYHNFAIRKKVKALNGSFWHQDQKLWSVLNTIKHRAELIKIIGNDYNIAEEPMTKVVAKPTLNEPEHEALLALEKVLILKRYSDSTVRSYKNMFCVFLGAFSYKPLLQVTTEDIQDFIHKLISTHKISASYQNQLINAIKAYYEHVLGQERTFYKINRPKKEISLPNVLSKSEVKNIINAPNNLKHKTILTLIYSAGLRISEAINLRVVDIHSKEGFIFIKSSKGKKDRKTILAKSLLPLLRKYYKKYRPSYWLFEGQTGGKYSVTSIRSVFRKAVEITGSNPWATVHTLRHSFATHCIENNVNMRHLQIMLGHSSSKTTEVYTRTVDINNKKITSPLDTFEN